jgi:tRNA A37 threonylcarbamoyladenosine biosynthesis protein TsaE
LNSAVELDDLDIDFTNSVVIVEWGAGLIEDLVDSWLEIVIDRPIGADAGELEGDLVEPRSITITGHGPRWEQA